MQQFVVALGGKPPMTRKVVALGMFDGVHLGHAALIAAAREIAGPEGCAAYTFDTHPANVVSPGSAPVALTSLEDRIALLGQAGADVVVVQRFDLEFAALSPREFVSRVMVETLEVGHIVVGYNYTFGRGASGVLKELASEQGVDVTVVAPVKAGRDIVASTTIRRFLAEGEVSRAARLLGREHFVRGTVVAGRGVGRSLDVPTANLDVPSDVALPARGVYAVRVRWGSPRGNPPHVSRGVCNIGVRPTFSDESRGTTVEVHLIDEEVDLYGQCLTVSFATRLRGEKRFADPGVLRTQIRRDIHLALQARPAPAG
ncbi:MAG: bifunctional riboflavin kinase/FAD synthetase, partial [Firmicutes bacterium]|nr:bifunctional riboflavin kinase/FAD synthetase [Bacillota bacterium]